MIIKKLLPLLLLIASCSKPQSVKEQWVEALRSGDYKQGKNTLRSSNNEFCCLGVLCDVINPNGWQDGIFSYNGEQRARYLPPLLRVQVGLSFSQERQLSRMNDNGQTFNQIADYIETNL